MDERPWAVAKTYTSDQKRAFAAALLRTPSDPFAAALAVFGAGREEAGTCLEVACTWPTDPEVVAFTQELLKNNGAKSFLPTREELARRLWEWTDSKLPIDDRIKAAKVLAEVMDWMPKAGTTVNVHNNVNNKVMALPVSASDADWEAQLQKQQEQLQLDAVAVH